MRGLRNRLLTVLLVGAVTPAAWAAKGAANGYFEFTVNGAWYRYSEGLRYGELATETISRFGAGIAYRFLSNTALEISYMTSSTRDKYRTEVNNGGTAEHLLVDSINRTQNLSMNIMLYLTDRSASFRPYIKGGIGVSMKGATFDAYTVDGTTGLDTKNLSPLMPSYKLAAEKSLTANGGLGLSYFLLNSVALELAGSVYASDIDKAKIFLDYSVTGGLRFVF